MLINAPVDTNKTLFISFLINFLYKYPEATTAEHPHPLPPASVFCASLLNIISPQSIWLSLISYPYSNKSLSVICFPTLPRSPVAMIS